MEFIPLALALVILWKVEASHADGAADLEFYKRKLAEYSDRQRCSVRADETDAIYSTHECTRAPTTQVAGDVRGEAPRVREKAV